MMRRIGWGGVASMSGPRGDGGPGYGLLQEVRGYWEGLRAPGELPDRGRIDPRGLDQALENVFLVERIAPGLARFRIAGMHLTVLMGMEVRGMPLSALFDPPGRDRLQTLLEQVFVAPAVLELALEGERGIGKPSLEGRMILLPVRGDTGLCDRALGCLVTAGPVGRTPRRFAIARHVVESLAAEADRPKAPLTPREPAPRGLAEDATPFAAAPGRPQRPHLRLVKSDD
jgi:hypothetical protein